MAELNYGDVQRAVQDGLRNLQADVQRLSGHLGNVSYQASRIDDIELLVKDLQRSMQQMQNDISTMRHIGLSGIDPRIAQMTADIHELKLRFAAVEKFAGQMSAFIQAKYEEEQEDQQYRSA